MPSWENTKMKEKLIKMRREERKKDEWGEQCYPSQFLSSCLGGTAVTNTHTQTHVRVCTDTQTQPILPMADTQILQCRDEGREPAYERVWGRGVGATRGWHAGVKSVARKTEGGETEKTKNVVRRQGEEVLRKQDERTEGGADIRRQVDWMGLCQRDTGMLVQCKCALCTFNESRWDIPLTKIQVAL